MAEAVPATLGGLFIDGRRVETSERLDVVDPATGRVVGNVARGGVEHVDAAVAAARAAGEGPWGRTTGRDRSKVLLRIAELIRENADELVRLESLDVGKPVGLCRPVDVETAA